MGFPYAHFCLDVETSHGEPTEAERWMRLHWSPNPSWKPETIGTKYHEMLAKKKEKTALIDGAPIVVVSIKTEQDLRCLHCLVAQEPRIVEGGMVEGFATQREMLRALRGLIEVGCDEHTVLIGHNIKQFDLPLLRSVFIRNGLKLPNALVCREQIIFDTMKEFAYGFSLERDAFVAVADVAEHFGMPHHKSKLGGADIPKLAVEGNVDLVTTYAILDALLEYNIFLRMVGMSIDEEPIGGGAKVIETAPANGQAAAAAQSPPNAQADRVEVAAGAPQGNPLGF